MKKNESTFILLKLFIGVLLVGIVSWPLFVCPGNVIKLFFEVTSDKELNVNISAVWIIILYLFSLLAFGIYLIVNSIIETQNYITHTCSQTNLNKWTLLSIRFRQFLSPTVYAGIIESVFIFIFPFHLILIDRILLPAALIYSILQKYILPRKKLEFLGLFIIIINHIIIHFRLDVEPWYMKYFFNVLERLAGFYNIQ